MTAPRRRRAFHLRFRLARGIPPTQAEFVTRSLVESADARGLVVAGSPQEASLLVIAREAGDAGAEDRRALARWAISRPELADYWVGPLVELPSRPP